MQEILHVCQLFFRRLLALGDLRAGREKNKVFKLRCGLFRVAVRRQHTQPQERELKIDNSLFLLVSAGHCPKQRRGERENLGRPEAEDHRAGADELEPVYRAAGVVESAGATAAPLPVFFSSAGGIA